MKINEQQILHIALLAKSAAKKLGYLEKKSGKKLDQSTVRWQKRWCVIYYNFMFYYETEASVKPQGVIFLEGTEVDVSEVTDLVSTKYYLFIHCNL
jgi:PH domain.